AVELAMRIGAALHCEIRPSVFARKNYFYPDQAKDYQISQYDLPLNVDGWLDLPDGSRVGVTRAHMEEDTGKLTHVGASGRINAADHALVDYNRSGVPLVEIVSEPDIRSAAQARAYASELRGILVATGASDGRMEEGSMRVDANVSVRPVGSDTFGTRCEIKNMNSLRSLVRAIEYEAARQIAVLEGGGTIDQETRHWDESAGRTDSMRSKEEANDYRYFPEPDLVPLAPDRAWRERIEAGLGAMPADRRNALATALGGSPTDAETDQIHAVVDLGLDALVTAAVESGAPVALALARAANEVAAGGEAGLGLDARTFAALLALEAGGQLSATQSKAVLAALIERGGGDPAAVAKEMGFEALGADTLGAVLDEVIAANPDEWSRFVAGDEKEQGKLQGFFTGKVMQATSGKANGKEVAAELRARRQAAG
ncbi:MAG TPA: Asp-tRNA(Asn)/Glu-tRNA(Gln) amidotransferase subunit GatB, partial [Acidimicrobiales bacterium]|nr:Asp-tRNA(Asn)/Glu-tRNA(Gln) amidotransferase subunit GatB [Acidimicrobiales bacterium]